MRVPELSVIILNYNVRYFLDLCVYSVLRATENRAIEVIVVDNDSSDESVDMVRKKYPQVIVQANKKNYGFAKAYNKAVAKAKGKYICILNPDTVLTEDTFDRTLAYYKRLENPGLLGIRLIDGKGDFLPESKRNVPTPKVALSKILPVPNKIAPSYYADHLGETENGSVSILVGAFMLVEKSKYTAVGGFDEDYFMYGEDIDLSYKMLKAGYQNYYMGDVAAIHFKGESTVKDEIYIRRFYGAMHLFYKKHFSTQTVVDSIVPKLIDKLSKLHKTPIRTKRDNIAPYYWVSDQKVSHSLPLVYGTIPIPSSSTAIGRTITSGTVIWDCDGVSFCRMIERMYANRGKECTYLIKLTSEQFLIGSNYSDRQGEVLHLSSTPISVESKAS